MDNITVNGSSQAKAVRFKQMRKILGLSVIALSQRLGCSRQVIYCWENAIGNGVSLKGAIKLVEVAEQCGVKCELNWLYYGIGKREGSG